MSSIAENVTRTIFATARPLALCLVAGALTLGAAGAQENGIRVLTDYARILKFDRPVSKVIIGNPEIADVAVSDPQTIVLTGRSFGTTNLVILDGEGTALVDERVVVSRDESDTLRVYRSESEPTILTCAPTCETPSTGGAALVN